MNGQHGFLILRASATALGTALGITFGLGSFCISGPVMGQEVAEQQNKLEPETGLEIRTPILKAVESTSVPARVQGVLMELHVQEGSRVTEGQVLGQLDSMASETLIQQIEARLRLARKRASSDLDLRMARNTQAVAQTEYERALQANARVAGTYPRNDIDRLRLVADQTQIEIDKAKYQVELAELEVQVAEAELMQAKEQRDRHRVQSPVAGLVVSVSTRKGEWAELGAELVRVVRLDRLRVEGFLIGQEADMDLVGARAEIKVQDLAETHVGRVAFVSPEMISVNSQVRVFIDVENKDGKLRPGMKLTASILPQPPSVAVDETTSVPQYSAEE